MIQNKKLRWFIILATFLVGAISLAPNFMTNLDKWPFSKKKIVYGLDIQGGIQLVMGADTHGVLVEKTSRLAKSLKVELSEQGIAVEKAEVDPEDSTQLKVSLGADADPKKFQKFLDDYYPATLQILDVTGTTRTLRFFDTKLNEYKQQIVNQAIEVLRNRIDEFGVAEPNISAQGADRILVQLPGIQDSARAKELINRTARLDFRPVVPADQVSPQQIQAWIEEAEKSASIKLGGEDGLLYGDYVKRLNEAVKGNLPANTRIVFEKSDNAENMEAGRIPFLVRTDTELSGAELEDASVKSDEFGKPEVVFSFTVEGRRRFAEITEANVGKLLAIVLDDVVQSAPVIQAAINSPTARITLGASRDYQKTMNEAQFIATALRAGALPATLEQLEERTVGPSIGADAIRKAAQGSIIGGILTLLFMIFYYRTAGVVADFALAFNIFLIFAVFTALGATLTLPGVAGIVLTIGMAVDANVLIFERIKEELRNGTGLKGAIQDGFSNALSAIVDSNVTTAAVCVVLMYFGTGPVRGFAVTLIIGTIASMFTSIFVTRTLIDFATERLHIRKLF